MFALYQSEAICIRFLAEREIGTIMNKSKICVKKSKIHGRGLFASDVITKGECIGIVQGNETKKDGDHVLWVTDDAGLNMTCDLRYINHAEKPNVCLYDTLEVVALKKIQPGEEITHNYEQE